jgi:hypothetical protein
MILTILFIAHALLCLAILYIEVGFRRGRNLATSLFYLTYSVVYVAAPLLLHFLFGGARSIVRDREDLFLETNVYICFNICGIILLLSSLLISLSQTWNPRPAAITKYPSTHHHFIAALVIAGLFAFVYSSQMSFGDLLAASRFAWTTDDPLLIGIGALAAYLVALTSFYVYGFWTSSRPRWIELALCIGAAALYGIVTKDRKWLFYIVSGLVAARYATLGRSLNIKIRHVVIGATLFVVFFISNSARDLLPRYALGEEVDLIPEMQSWCDDQLEFGDLTYFYRATIEAIHQNIDNGFLIPCALLRRIVFFPLPTHLSGGLKVEEISATFSDVVGGETGTRRGSMPPGLFGLFVVSFGMGGAIALMPVLAVFVSWLDKCFRERNGVFVDVALAHYFAGVIYLFRGDEGTSLYVPLVNGCVLLFCSGFMKSAREQRREGAWQR